MSIIILNESEIPISMIPDDILAEYLELASSCPPGPIVEVGVFRGGSAWHFAQLARKQKRELHLFDTFEGMPPPSCKTDFNRPGWLFSSYEAVKMAIPDARIYKGWFPDTLPNDLENIAFVHADCDLYTSVKNCIWHLYPRLVPGGIMLFDDYPEVDNAVRAVNESRHPLHFTPIGKRAWIRKP